MLFMFCVIRHGNPSITKLCMNNYEVVLKNVKKFINKGSLHTLLRIRTYKQDEQYAPFVL